MSVDILPAWSEIPWMPTAWSSPRPSGWKLCLHNENPAAMKYRSQSSWHLCPGLQGSIYHQADDSATQDGANCDDAAQNAQSHRVPLLFAFNRTTSLHETCVLCPPQPILKAATASESSFPAASVGSSELTSHPQSKVHGCTEIPVSTFDDGRSILATRLMG